MKMRAGLAAISSLCTAEELHRILAYALDRPVVEGLVAKIARGRAMDLTARSREDLIHAALTFAARDKAVRKQLEAAIMDATRLERAKLVQVDEEDWRAALDPHLQQRRGSAKMLLAMAVEASLGQRRWGERMQAVLAGLREQAAARDDLLHKAEAAGIGESVRSLEHAFADLTSRKGTLETQVSSLERERALVVVALGQREAELKRAREQGEALARELERVRRDVKVESADDDERDALKRKLRKLEKMAEFAREREHDRERLRLVEQERDVLAKEVVLLRVQLQIAQLHAARAVVSTPPPAPIPGVERRSRPREPVSQPQARARRSALYVDGANVASAARLLYDRKVDFARLRDELLGRDGSATMCAYVVDGADEPFAAFVRRLKREGYRVTKRAPKVFPDGTTKADLDVDLAVDLMAERHAYDRVVIVSGDSDFVPLVKRLKHDGIRVEAAAFRARAANELIAAVDAFIPLDEKVLS